jgi:hypothetical protein
VPGRILPPFFIFLTIKTDLPSPAMSFTWSPARRLLKNAVVYGGISGNYTAQYSLIEGNTETTNGNVNATGITATHVFTDPENGDYSLLTCASSINAGTPDTTGLHLPALDPSGQSRIFGDRIDMGAFENRQMAVTPALAEGGRKAIRVQQANGTTLYLDGCNGLLVSMTTTGLEHNVQGLTTAGVWVDTEQNRQYVKRHYEIYPEEGAETATGLVTLFLPNRNSTSLTHSTM